ncbi:hypothetical protein Tco_1521275, partial [Tanacetum coccineum]
MLPWQLTWQWDHMPHDTTQVVRYEVRVSGGRVTEPIIGVRGMGSRANHWLGLRKHLEGVCGMLPLVDPAGVLGTQAEAIIGNKSGINSKVGDSMEGVTTENDP